MVLHAKQVPSKILVLHAVPHHQNALWKSLPTYKYIMEKDEMEELIKYITTLLPVMSQNKRIRASAELTTHKLCVVSHLWPILSENYATAGPGQNY